jgi:hypothetical protein
MRYAALFRPGEDNAKFETPGCETAGGHHHQRGVWRESLGWQQSFGLSAIDSGARRHPTALHAL